MPKLSLHLQSLISTALVDLCNISVLRGEELSRTELDSHANMPVVGRNSYVISNSGKTADVNAFTPDHAPLTIPIVDAAIQYDSPYDGKSYILIIRNALYVESMVNNLIPPFIMRESGIQVNDTPKIQIESPGVDDHSILFPSTSFRIPMSLWGVFSYFPTTKPSAKMMEECEEVYILTPDCWNPHSNAYATNEDSMLDWQGEMVEKRDRRTILVEDIEDDQAMAASLYVGACEQKLVNENFRDVAINKIEEPIPNYIPPEADQIASVFDEINPTLNDERLCQRMEEVSNLSKFKMTIGATTMFNGMSDDEMLTLLDQDYDSDSDSETEDDHNSDDKEDDLDKLYKQSLEGQMDLDEMFISATHADKAKGVSAEQLSKTWRVSIDDALRTLDVTTQRSTRTQNPTLSRNYGTNDRMLRYKRINDYFYMDTFFATKKAGKSSRGNKCSQLFVTDRGFIYVVPMKSKSEVLLAVKQFAKEIGAPDALISDAAKEQTSHNLRKFCGDIGTTLRVLEEGTPWSNKAELYIGIIKEAVRKDMKESNCPLAFWDYCLERRARINNLTAKDRFHLQGTNAYTNLTSEQGDISNLCTFKWYEWGYFRENKARFPFNKEILGKVLGPAKGEGNEMAQWVLKANGQVVPRRSIRPLHTAEIHSPTEIKKREVFDALIERRWGTAMLPPNPDINKEDKEEEWEPYEDEDEQPHHFPDTEEAIDHNGRLINQQPAYDKLLNNEVMLQLGESMERAKVTRRSLGPDGQVVGKYDNNPNLNSIVYECEFNDGTIREYAANLIAENMLTQVDEDGFSITLMEGIIDHRKNHDTAVSREDAYVVTRRGQKRPRKTTAGWEFLIKWKDGSEQWTPLKILKDSHPVEVAEYSKARGISNEPAFSWWVPYTLKKRDFILSAVKSRVRRTTHKYGIEIPRNIAHAYEIDEKNGNHFWRNAINKEMTDVGIAFEILPEGKKPPPGWHKVTGHLVFDVKMDFTRKARWVLDGHKTPDPIGSTYAGVVSRESVRIAFTYAALNGVDVFAADIRNAYLQAPSSQRDYIICGAEFGLENIGNVALIHRALYGGKKAGSDFRNHLRSCMRHLGFTSCPADPDVWLREAEKSNGDDYYEYILLYTDDALVISANAEDVLRKELGRYFELKEESIRPPKLYLGGHCRKVQLENGVNAWAFGSSQYVQAAVKNVKDYLDTQDKYKMPAKPSTPMRTSYRPELDITPELQPTMASYYMSLIGILRWICELGRVDICLEVSMMSSHMAMPREGHLEQVLNIFGYLDNHHNAELVFDPSDPVIDTAKFERRDWTSSEFGHIEGKEELPKNAPPPRGLGFVQRAKVDADHAGDTVTRRSRTGFLIYLNNALVYWFSKKQTSVESSSFGSEFVAMKQCCEYLKGLRYKLRMMGIPCEGPAYIEGDNQSVLANTSIPDSTLKKKNASIAYHFVREGVARDMWRTAYVNTHDNEADLLTKLLPSGEKRKGFVRSLLHHVHRSEEPL